MLSSNLLPFAPMWTGWNSIKADSQMKQSVQYMRNTQLPPTRDDVIRQTLKTSHEVATDCGDEFSLVTYDLACAKIARHIQIEESPKSVNCFIQFGQFHTLRGVANHILSEADIIAMGSMGKFLKGKMCNRCKRGHTLLSTAMQRLHLERFIEDIGISEEEINNLQQCIKSEEQAVSETLKILETQCTKYKEETLNGMREKTAQYWMTYCQIFDLIHLMQRAMKSNDIPLYSYALFQAIPIFFTTNHHNYARWMSLYTTDLFNIK